MSASLIGLVGVVVGALIAAVVSLVTSRQKNEELRVDREHALAREQRDRRATVYTDLSVLLNRLQDGVRRSADTKVEILDQLAKLRIFASTEVQELFLAFVQVAGDDVNGPTAARAVQRQMHAELTGEVDTAADEETAPPETRGERR